MSLAPNRGPLQWGSQVVPWFNIVQAPFRIDQPPYNGKCDWNGSTGTDDTTAWTSLIADLTARGYGDIKLPAGMSICNSGVIKLPSRSSIIGTGPSASGLVGWSDGNPLIEFSGVATATFGTPVEDVTIADMNLWGGAMSNPNALIRTYYAKHCRIERIDCSGGAGGGFIDAVQLWDTFLHSLQLDSCGVGATSTCFRFRNAASATPSAFGYSNDSSNNVYISDVRTETFQGRALAIEQGSLAGQNIYSFFIKNFKAETAQAISAPIVELTGTFNSFFRDWQIVTIGWLSGTVPIDLIRNNGSGGNVFDGMVLNQGVSHGVNNPILSNVSSGQADSYQNIYFVYTGTAPTSAGIINNTGSTPPALGPFADTFPANFPPLTGNSATGTTQTVSANASTIAVPLGRNQTVLTISGTFTGQILAAGRIDGQVFTIIVNGATNACTWNATDATARVKLASSNNIPANTAKRFMWNAATALWWPAA